MQIILGINITGKVIYIYFYRNIVGYKSTPNRWSQHKYAIFQLNGLKSANLCFSGNQFKI